MNSRLKSPMVWAIACVGLLVYTDLIILVSATGYSWVAAASAALLLSSLPGFLAPKMKLAKGYLLMFALIALQIIFASFLEIHQRRKPAEEQVAVSRLPVADFGVLRLQRGPELPDNALLL